ncbi:hypothetical protein HAX54_013517, partial [Datura stramonium]|nr:hypothetical protein [Datura stramonium]
IKEILAKVLKKVESTNSGIKEIRGDPSSVNQLKKRALLSDSMPNPKNDNYCIVITARSGRVLELVVELVIDNQIDEDSKYSWV